MSHLRDVENAVGERPDAILEATGHYHNSVVQFLEQNEYRVFVVNPLISQRARKSQLRKLKTDLADARHLADLYYKEEFEPFKRRDVQILNLRHLTRQHEAITTMYVQAKLNFQAILDQVFPLYVGVFSDLYSVTSLKLIQKYRTPTDFFETNPSQIAENIMDMNHRSKSLSWAQNKAELLQTAAANSPTVPLSHHSYHFTLNMMADMLLQYKEHLENIEQEIDTLANNLSECTLLQSIPGIGKKISATVLAEIGDIEQFNSAKKLVAFAGVDPSVFSSGKFKSTENRITKRGSKRLRRALFLAVQCGLRKGANVRLRVFYDRKRVEGKANKVALIACVNKLLHTIFAILSKREAFRQSFSPEITG
ncbi:IS110 family transposase [Alicyclobacillus suci]|uniref:IS110 family transposase n=1 Tax=Alicyclobacillus suci TaxID=2816080 RepID=UPI001F35975D